MTTTPEWNYTAFARSYAGRPEYAPTALDAVLAVAGVEKGQRVCDVGAGTGHLTLPLLSRGLMVDAVEPNDAMRAEGIARTAAHDTVTWTDGMAEHSGLEGQAYRTVTFGSSFNVTNRPAALRETARLLAPGGWFVCMWNHRVLTDPLQAEIEHLIADRVPGYSYGTRREDQTTVIESSGLFHPVVRIEVTLAHRVATGTWLEAWSSHATLARQAGAAFDEVVAAIRERVSERAGDEIEIPYVTRIWAARVR